MFEFSKLPPPHTHTIKENLVPASLDLVSLLYRIRKIIQGKNSKSLTMAWVTDIGKSIELVVEEKLTYSSRGKGKNRKKTTTTKPM